MAWAVQFESVPLPGLAPIANVTVLASLVIRLPWESSTRTIGCVFKAVPPVPLPGWVENAS